MLTRESPATSNSCWYEEQPASERIAQHEAGNRICTLAETVIHTLKHTRVLTRAGMQQQTHSFPRAPLHSCTHMQKRTHKGFCPLCCLYELIHFWRCTHKHGGKQRNHIQAYTHMHTMQRRPVVSLSRQWACEPANGKVHSSDGSAAAGWKEPDVWHLVCMRPWPAAGPNGLADWLFSLALLSLAEFSLALARVSPFGNEVFLPHYLELKGCGKSKKN